ncbi:hypothetical protein HK097_002598 [Rhizophlyctis rosea]|uniref:DNA primase/polymerase bifunctional N-terminal domain-containing protein n=1 Tax=Rhizophlyctis rosea TaxID=64517 RepID=A0AAD5SGC9_9FUNG|nr:hypothetical protein HK097_002598 [Rhizophlyctis rosea]
MPAPGFPIDELESTQKKFINKGFLPILAYPTEKRPLGDWKNFTVHDWSKSVKRIPGLRANIGVLTGDFSNIVVLDIDNTKTAKQPKYPNVYRDSTGMKDWKSLTVQHGEPQTLKCTTPSGETHYYFPWDGELAEKVKTTAPCVNLIDGKLSAIDMSADKGFIMTPPSISNVGQFVGQPHDRITDIPIAPMPEWFKSNFEDLTVNGPVDIADFELFKLSKLYNNHQFVIVDGNQRIILKESMDFDCPICERRHKHHFNHPFLVRRGETLLFVCRPLAGGTEAVQAVTTGEGGEEKKKERKEEETPHQVLMKLIWADAKLKGLQKLHGFIYKLRRTECSAGFEDYMNHEDYVNQVLRDHPVFTAVPERADAVMQHLEFYNNTDLPFMRVDQNILDFDNGCLVLKEVECVNNQDSRVEKRAARKCIDQEYTGDEDTPTFDKLVNHQYEDIVGPVERSAVIDMLLAQIGRLFFKVRLLVKWAVALTIIGGSNTGRSTLCKIIRAMHNSKDVGVLGANFKKTFGLRALLDKTLLVIEDMPVNMKDVVDPTIIQASITGEHQNIPIKLKRTECGTITAP